MAYSSVEKRNKYAREYYHRVAKYKKEPYDPVRKANLTRSKSRNYAYMMKYKSEHPCAICGESRLEVLDFHHYRGVKRNDVNRICNRGNALDVLITEIDKCIILCASCHRMLHYYTDSRHPDISMIRNVFRPDSSKYKTRIPTPEEIEILKAGGITYAAPN